MFKTQWIICGIETHELEVSSQKCKLSIWKFATSLSRFNEAIISIWRLFGEAIKDIKVDDVGEREWYYLLQTSKSNVSRLSDLEALNLSLKFQFELIFGGVVGG